MSAFVDASVIVAILKREPGSEKLIERLSEETGRLNISPLVRFEAVAALVKVEVEALQASAKVVTPAARALFIEKARRLVDRFVSDIEAQEVVIDASTGQGALDAMAAYGHMGGHPAKLNFGDCFAYASAKQHELALIYKGDDFSQTDLANVRTGRA